MTKTTDFNAQDYEQRYQAGYGHAYPESHIIRVDKHVLEWELGLRSGAVFDFGCGAGANLKYFSDKGYIPYGCDTSASAIDRCRQLLPAQAGNFHVSSVNPDLRTMRGPASVDVFLSNQVLYFLDDGGIRDVVKQAFEMVRPGGVFIASMMSYSCWYARYIVGVSGDFKKVELRTPREHGDALINFKQRSELQALFDPFAPLHIGSYGSHIRTEEGSTDHWLYVGIKR